MLHKLACRPCFKASATLGCRGLVGSGGDCPFQCQSHMEQFSGKIITSVILDVFLLHIHCCAYTYDCILDGSSPYLLVQSAAVLLQQLAPPPAWPPSGVPLCCSNPAAGVKEKEGKTYTCCRNYTLCNLHLCSLLAKAKQQITWRLRIIPSAPSPCPALSYPRAVDKDFLALVNFMQASQCQ